MAESSSWVDALVAEPRMLIVLKNRKIVDCVELLEQGLIVGVSSRGVIVLM